MSGLTGKAALDAQGLRDRNVSLQANDDEEARKAVLHLNALEEKAEKNEKDKKTFGRTPDGIGKGTGIRLLGKGRDARARSVSRMLAFI
jgi:hypothetical protein